MTLTYVPVPQSAQTVDDEAEYFPASQLSHAVLTPADALNFPASQLMQVLATVAPTVVEYVPAPQLMQVLATVAPTVVEYVPAPQGTRSADLPAQKYPAGHSTPEGVDEPSGQ